MNVLFITQSIVDPYSGGVQRVTYTLGNEFERMGLNVFFVSVKSNGRQDGLDPRQFSFPNTAMLVNEANFHFFEQFIKSHSIDFIINQVGIFPEINAFLKKADRGSAKLVSVHHNCVACLNARYREIVLGNNSGSWLWKRLDYRFVWSVLRFLNRIKYGGFFRKAIQASDKLVLLSSRFIPELKHFGVNGLGRRVSAIGNPLSFDPVTGPLQKENRVLFVGRLRLTQKRVDKLMAIWKCLHQEFPDWKFDIVGDGEARRWMEAFVAEHDLNRVHFHGVTDPRPYLRQARFLTSTSDFEGYPMVIVEAQAYGVIPVFYHCFSAITDMIEDGKTGFIVSDFSTKAYIEKMRLLLSYPDKASFDTMTTAMKERVLETIPSVVASRWMNLFDELNAPN